MERHVPSTTAQISVGSSRLRLLANINLYFMLKYQFIYMNIQCKCPVDVSHTANSPSFISLLTIELSFISDHVL